MRYDLVEKVLKDLEGIVPYKKDIIWLDCNSMSYLGRYNSIKNRIAISNCIVKDEDILSTMAHELIHSAGVHNHGEQFKYYMYKINSLNLCYKVTIRGACEMQSNRKTYRVYCENCGWERIYYKKFNNLEKYRCPKCHQKELVQLRLV